MRGNRLIKKVKELQKLYGHDVEILLHKNGGFRDICFDNVNTYQGIRFGTIEPIGDTYVSSEHIIHDIMEARHYGRYRGYEHCTILPHLTAQEHLAAITQVRGGVRYNNDSGAIPF